MIVDITGIMLVPGYAGRDCPGNGKIGECCCDKCDYLICCFVDEVPSCAACDDLFCPRVRTAEKQVERREL